MKEIYTISHEMIPSIISTIDVLDEGLRSIDNYACQDFKLIKPVLDDFKSYIDNASQDQLLHAKFSEIFTELQYVDKLQQRLTHVQMTNTQLTGELVEFRAKADDHALAYWYITKLNNRQFQAAIDAYVKTTVQIKQVISDVLEAHRDDLSDLLEARLLYLYNGSILSEASTISDIYFKSLLNYQHPKFPTPENCAETVMRVGSFYSMEEERQILQAFLKGDMNLSNGYDIDSDHETISIF